MVARNDRGIGTPQRLRTHRSYHRLARKSRPPVSTPDIVGRRIAKQRANRFLLAQGPIGEVPESQRVVNFLALHRGEKPRGEVEIGLFLTHQSELGARAFEPMTFVLLRKGVDNLSGARDGTVSISIDQRQKRLREARKVPLRDPWLIGVGIAAVSVDGA